MKDKNVFVGHKWRSISARIMGKKSPIFDVEHPQLFPLDSARLGIEDRFVNVEVGRLLNRYPIGLSDELLPLPPRDDADANRNC